ncbi:MAG: hypothetical protein J6125_03860, partial [Clostridia bacterium]|nr:hypothetical protein [Clostridia bacterium]
RLRRLDARRAALQAALDRLGRGAYSAARLCERLTAGGATREDAVWAVRACIRMGYLREKEQLSDVCRRMYDDGRGPRRITAKCLCDGYRAADVEAVLAEAERSGQFDFAARRRELAALWRSRGLTETEIKKKLDAAGFACEDE